MTYGIKVKRDKMRELKKLYRLSSIDMAKRIGVTPQTYERAMSGQNVSAGFIAGATLGFQIGFDQLFTSVETETVTAA